MPLKANLRGVYDHVMQVVFFCLLSSFLRAQCPVTVSSFPYIEGFENSTGNWTSGGASSDWIWGSPSKNIIAGAAASQKCWITGGLTGNFYNFGQRSFLESPCFNFTGITNPYISFSVFWDTENQYDGASFQYSTDGGATWNYVGSTSGVSNCLNGNWFNTPNINNLSTMGSNPKNGWSGNTLATNGSCTGSGGLGQWVTAKQQMPFLSGSSSVKFRFTFGAGSQCNNYNGFAIDNIYVGESPASFTAVTSNTAAGCNSANGSATINVSGGVAPYSYAWSGFTNNTSTLNNVFAGSYNVVVTDGGNCTANFSITVPSSAPVQFNGTTSPDTCGKGKGKIQVNVTNGTGPYSFQWSNGNGSQPIVQNLTPGAYTVTVTDSKSCSSTATFTVSTISGPSSVTWTATPDTCSLHKGILSLGATNGTAPFKFSWAAGSLSSNTIANLVAGSYPVTVTDAYGCTASNGATVGNYNSFSVNSSLVPDSCLRGKGRITLSTSGGTAPFQYVWSNNISGTSIAQNLVAGNYTVTVTDGSGCTVVNSLSLTSVNSMLASAVTNADTCNLGNGSIRITATNGKPPYSYQWATGTSGASVLQNVATGNYTVIVNDNGVCSKTVNAVVTLIPGFTFTGTTLPDTCGKNTGEIILTTNGGISPFAYQWSNGAPSQPVAQNLPKGTYHVTATDTRGCHFANSYSVNEVPSVRLSLSSSPDTCSLNAGAITIQADNGTLPYHYQWSGGSVATPLIKHLAAGTYSVTVTDSKNCIAGATATVSNVPGFIINYTTTPDTCDLGVGVVSFSPTGGIQPFTYKWQNDTSFVPLIDGLSKGNYVFTLTDARNCSISQAVEIENTGNITINLGGRYVICPGNPVTLYPGQFQNYLWSNGSAEPALEANTSGNYWVEITDEHGCKASDTAIVVEDCLNTVLFPKAFSPNGDGKNEMFTGYASNVSDYHLQIFNRWGQLVFSSPDLYGGWSGSYQGKTCPSGIYSWKCNFTIEGKSQYSKGSVMLIR